MIRAQQIYNYLLNNESRSFFSRLLRKVLRKYVSFSLSSSEPIVRYSLQGRVIKIPWTHSLPHILKIFPFYSDNVSRIGKYLNDSFKNFTMIDIGANVGDTVILQKAKSDYPMLCVEGNNFYFSLLKENVQQYENVQLAKNFLGENDEQINATIQFQKGTGNIATNVTSTDSISIVTLPTLLNNYTQFKQSKFLKIDTDGYDLQILYGAKKFLKSAKPVIFFEYDPFFFTQHNQNGLKIFDYFSALKYSSYIFYDNYGDILITFDKYDRSAFSDLHNYISERKGSRYYDICVFHSEDYMLFKKIRLIETKQIRKTNNAA